MVDAGRHPKIGLMSYAEVKKVEGYVGNFRVKIEPKPRYVTEFCNACGDCLDVCPVKVPNEFDQGLSPRHAIYQPFAQAIPSTYVIDSQNCIRCYKCVDVCERQAVDFSQEPREIELEVGSIVLATGFDAFEPTALSEYGYGRLTDVITSMDLERLLDPSGPVKGELIRPSDFSLPGRVAFIQCAGSRDERYNPYCSGYCCMASIKTALHLREKYPQIEVAIFYMDIRTPHKGYEEFYRRAREKGVIFIPRKPSEVASSSGTPALVLHYEDPDRGRPAEWETDLVVLATGAVPAEGAHELANRMSVTLDENGFYREYHPKLRPIDSLTEGIFFAGAASAPKDIPYSVSQGSAAAARACRILMKESLVIEPIVARVDPGRCLNVEKKCGVCAARCPFGAITIQEGQAAFVVPAKCMGCGTCVAECPKNCITQHHFRDLQILAQIDTYLSDSPEDKILAFMCWWCSYPGADNAGVNHIQYPPSSRGIRVMCAGRIKREFVLQAFRRGAGMVMVSGCHPQDCHYITGQHHAERRLSHLFRRLEKIGISSERFRLEWISAAEGDKYARVITEMDQTLKSIGKKRIKEENERAYPELEKRLSDIPDLSLFSGERPVSGFGRTG
ncbi:hydrogenase iron-sulfur subunit [Thermodesulfobacteriota bacterium]